MPQSESWPFKRLMVDHLFHGITRVWWTLDAKFNDDPPHTFQLQAGYTGNSNALDWVDVGDPAVNAYYLDDDGNREPAGKRILTHYRVVLATARGPFVSNPQGINGTLDNKDWGLAREIVRKERLRNGLVSVDGYLIRKFRYGVQSTAATDLLTDEVIDSGNLESWGTAFKVGYHPPVSLATDMSTEKIVEFRGGGNVQQHNSQPTGFPVRIIAFPDVAKEDVWVDGETDQRWVIHDITIEAAWRGVPLIHSCELRLVPHDNVIYKIPVTSLSFDPGDSSEFQPTTGPGCVNVDHDYGEESVFIYQTGDCCGIEGATILAFTKVDYDGGARLPAFAIATSQTTANGTWAWAMKLDPGEYVLIFEKIGEFGPDTVNLTVQPPDPGPPPSVSSSVSSSSEFGSF